MTTVPGASAALSRKLRRARIASVATGALVWICIAAFANGAFFWLCLPVSFLEGDVIGDPFAYGPLAAVLLCTLCIWPAVRYARRDYQDRIMQHLGQNACACCDYNLEGNVSGVCPECGSAVQRRPLALRGNPTN